MKKCIFNGPHVMTRVLVPAQPAIETDPPVPEHTIPKTYKNTLLKKHAYIDAEAKEIHMILSGIEDDIYSTVDACTTTKEIWTTIERLQQGESLNKQDVKTNLFLEFSKFTSRDGESIESYYLSNKNTDMSLRNMIDNQSRQFVNQRTLKVVKAKETIGNQVAQWIQCFNCKGFEHLANEYRIPKRVKDYAFHKKKIMLCNQEEKGVPLSADQRDWLNDTDEEPNKQELEDEEEVSSDDNEMVKVKVLMVLDEDNDVISKKGIKRPWLSEADDFILPNHDTDSTDESFVCSTPLPPLKKLVGAEPVSRPKTIKSVLRSKSTFKAETLKGVIINEPSSALLRDEEEVSSDDNEMVKVKVLMVLDEDNDVISKKGIKRPWLSEADDFILPNHDTDSTDESFVCSTPLPPLKKLVGAEPVSRPKTIKSVLRSKSTFKAETLKGVIINEPSSALLRVTEALQL
uniref:Retrovirus-related Pol polyprotein from transposon TNT 1-94 n=1 Tax=Tanacetum cinerariifolium TaxID=118510 RepID=A0A6L2JPB9_TANCI|nr:hypothetical protein [Tanacetum cinerariifolium]